MGDGRYDVASICLNGHLITDSARSHSIFSTTDCRTCGAPTTTRCDSCGCDIRGCYYAPGAYSFPQCPQVPSFCHNCGKPYPWTESRLQAAKDLARELDGLTREDIALLERSVDEMVRDTPQANVAALRFKRIVVKTGKVGTDLFKDILVGVVSETVRKTVWGP